MATTKKIEVPTINLESKPGSLTKVYAAIKEAKLNILGSWAYEMGPGQAQAHFYCTDTAKLKETLTKLGMPPKTEWACLAEGADNVGAFAELLQKISDAKVNLHATIALSTGGKFATVFCADQKDITALCKALGC